MSAKAMFAYRSMFLVFAVCLSVAGLSAQASSAGKTDVFFEALYDVPVMPGLEELKDQAVLFDKPDGRIASVMAASNNLKPQDVSNFYSQTLPQLGWKKTSENQYIRGKDRLSMDISQKPPLTIVRFTLAPLK